MAERGSAIGAFCVLRIAVTDHVKGYREADRKNQNISTRVNTITCIDRHYVNTLKCINIMNVIISNKPLFVAIKRAHQNEETLNDQNIIQAPCSRFSCR